MNIVDATDRGTRQDDVDPPSLLTIILDTNPSAWALLSDSLPLSTAVANLIVFINAHLAINYANQVAIIASHSDRAEWLYPIPHTPHASPEERSNGEGTHLDARDADTHGLDPTRPPNDANKYRPFAQVEHALMYRLRTLMSHTTPSTASSSPATLLAGALTLALTHISKQTLLQPGASTNPHFNYSDPSAVAGTNDLDTHNRPPGGGGGSRGLTSRILIISVSGDLADRYIEVMNAIFACQRLSLPIDVCKLAGDPVFLQQAADTTGGIYLALNRSPLARAGFLQSLMFAFLPDPTVRRNLIVPGEGAAGGEDGEGGGVDFRAACLCHKRVVDLAFVCSICLSIFCEPFPDGLCLLCGTRLAMTDYGRKPVVVVPASRKKKKKKRALEGDPSTSGSGTPVPG